MSFPSPAGTSGAPVPPACPGGLWESAMEPANASRPDGEPHGGIEVPLPFAALLSRARRVTGAVRECGPPEGEAGGRARAGAGAG